MSLDTLIRDVNPAPVDTVPGPGSFEARAILEAIRANPSRHRRWSRPQPGPWTRRVMVVAVAAVILAAFFVPLPHVSLFNRLVAPAKPPTETSVPVTVPKRPHGRTTVLGYGFNGPDAIAVDGTHVWVANANDNSVTKLRASTGALVKILSASSYGFGVPDAIAADGTHVWVANQTGNSVTELNASTGALVKVLSDSSYGFDRPDAIAAEGTHVWVANGTGNSVSELSQSTGALVRVLSGSSYGFDWPDAIAVDGTHVWVANREGRSVVELNASTGALIKLLYPSFGNRTLDAIAADGTHVWVANARVALPCSGTCQSGNVDLVTEFSQSTGAPLNVLSSSSYGFEGPDAVAADGTHVWVANGNGNSVTELNASTGALVKVLSDPSYGFDGPVAIAVDGTHVWVANLNGNSVTELNASTGALVKVLAAASWRVCQRRPLMARECLSPVAHVVNLGSGSVPESMLRPVTPALPSQWVPKSFTIAISRETPGCLYLGHSARWAATEDRKQRRSAVKHRPFRAAVIGAVLLEGRPSRSAADPRGSPSPPTARRPT
jgi:DNA-binding beta-propeller fold protein YncE